MSEEVWRAIPGFPDYEVSNIGNVRSVDRSFVNSIGRHCVLKGKPIIPRLEKGYHRVGVRGEDRKKVMMSVHRAVALAFLPNPYSYATVNHINGIKNDNRVENLEWCSVKENIAHAYRNNLNGYADKSNEKISKINEVNAYKEICVTSPNGKVFTFQSTKEVSDYFGIKITTINDALSKKPHRAFGYTFVGKR